MGEDNTCQRQGRFTPQSCCDSWIPVAHVPASACRKPAKGGPRHFAVFAFSRIPTDAGDVIGCWNFFWTAQQHPVDELEHTDIAYCLAKGGPC